MRSSLLTLSLLTVGSVLNPLFSRADSFAIELEAKAAKNSQKTQGKTAATPEKPKSRVMLSAEVGKPIQVTWKVTSTATREEMKDVLIHLFVVRLPQVGQTAVPKLDRDVAAETALTMDFQPKDTAHGALEFQIDKPGAYLVRVETRGGANSGNAPDHFAALDLVVK
jgi:hypothetical protein